MEQIDKAKLLEWLDVEIDLSSGNDPVLRADRWAFRQAKKAIESGRFDITTGRGTDRGVEEQKQD